MSNQPPEAGDRAIGWAGYIPFDPDDVSGPLDAVSRATATRFFERLMEARNARIGALRTLLAQSGVPLEDSDASIVAVEEWLRESVRGDPDQPDGIDPMWLSVAFDIGVWLGELMTQRRPELHWKLFVEGRRDASYHRPVVMGFDLSNERYNVDPIRTATAVVIRIATGRSLAPNPLLSLLEAHNADDASLRRRNPR